jgi:Replication initiator protein A
VSLGRNIRVSGQEISRKSFSSKVFLAANYLTLYNLLKQQHRGWRSAEDALLLLLSYSVMKQKMLLDTDIPDEVSPPHRPGKDEMNFAEYPIALLTDRVPKGQKSLKFEDEVYSEKRRKLITRRRVIEGSEEYGLPTATDDLVILALIQLTKLKGDFKHPKVEFSRLELISMLGWADEGRSYDRIKLSLLRIKGVTYFYDNAWWDPRLKDWTTKAFSIIDNVEINDSRVSHGQGGLFPSRIKWNEVVFDSFQAGFLRDIDFQLCIRLQHPTALRMYRFLGKRFYVRPEWEFDLKVFANEHMALGRNYEGGTQIARKLQPAIDELEQVGFLEPLPEHERFTKKGHEWTIRFVQKPPSPAALPALATPSPPAEPSPLIDALAERGVTRATAAELVQRHPAETIQLKIEVFDYLLGKQDKRVAKSPAGYLVKSITDDYAPPKGFVTRAERQAREEARQAAERQKAEQHRREQEQEARERAERQKINAYWEALTPEQQAEHDAAALAQADPGMVELLKGPTKRLGMTIVRDQHTRRILQQRGILPAEA